MDRRQATRCSPTKRLLPARQELFSRDELALLKEMARKATREMTPPFDDGKDIYGDTSIETEEDLLVAIQEAMASGTSETVHGDANEAVQPAVSGDTEQAALDNVVYEEDLDEALAQMTIDHLSDTEQAESGDYPCSTAFDEVVKEGRGEEVDDDLDLTVVIVANHYNRFATQADRLEFEAEAGATGRYAGNAVNIVSLLFKIYEHLGMVSRETRLAVESVYKPQTGGMGDAGRSDRQIREILFSVPFGQIKAPTADLDAIEACLNQQCYAMDKAKSAVMEHITLALHGSSVRVEPIILVGDPGCGKTRFAQTLGDAIGLPFQKISFAGAYDVSLFKGSPRHWSSGYPGLLIKTLQGLDCMNPVVLLDEIDKSGGCSTGNVMDILAEILDPRQSHSFEDSYLGIPVDLAKVVWICTCNDLDAIPVHIIDRCRVIRIENYTRNERAVILRDYIARDIVRESGFPFEIVLGDDAVEALSGIESLRRGRRAILTQLSRVLRDRQRGDPHAVDIETIDDDILGTHGSTGSRRPLGFNR